MSAYRSSIESTGFGGSTGARGGREVLAAGRDDPVLLPAWRDAGRDFVSRAGATFGFFGSFFCFFAGFADVLGGIRAELSRCRFGNGTSERFPLSTGLNLVGAS